MKYWPSQRVFALVLGVVFTLGLSLSAVEAGDMAVQMAKVMESGASSQDDCGGCGGGDGGMDVATCSPALNCAGMTAVLPVERGLAATDRAVRYTPVSELARDLTGPPDPEPPRSRDLA